MQRGKITILIILFVAFAAALSSVWYHFRNQQRAQRFWGTQTALLIDKAPQAEVLELSEAGRGLSLGGDDDTPDDSESDGDPEAAPEATIKAIEFNGTPWLVTTSQDATAAKGITNLRRALVLDTTYDWVELPESIEPRWQYGLEIEDGHNWATVLFDFDARLVGLAGGRTLAVMNAEANDEFKGFFAEQFADSKPDESAPAAGAPSDSAN